MKEIINYYFKYKCETWFIDMKRLLFNEFYCINCNKGFYG